LKKNAKIKVAEAISALNETKKSALGGILDSP